jgi:hypothetical protein
MVDSTKKAKTQGNNKRTAHFAIQHGNANGDAFE